MISPADQEKLAEAVRRVYVQLEQQILAQIAARLGGDDQEDGWRERNLAEVRKQRAEVEKLLATFQRKVPELLQDVIQQAYQAGVDSADDDLGRLAALPGSTITVAEENLIAGFGAIHTKAIEALVSQQYMLFSKMHLQILRSADDAYRSVIANTAGGTIAGAETRRQSTQRALNLLADVGIRGFTDAAGRRWEIGAYAEMATRTAVGNASITGHINRMLEQGRDLVIVSDHMEECDRCRPWERKVLSISGNTPGYPTVAAARNAGLWHPNCGHTINAYVEGLTKDVDTGQADPGGYELRQKQRYMERQVRRWKRRELVAVTNSDLVHAQDKIAAWQGELRKFVAAHDRLRQNHREQIRIGRAGVEKHFKDVPWIK